MKRVELPFYHQEYELEVQRPPGLLKISLTKCPKCGSTDVTTRRHESFAFGECFYDYCFECEHQWNHA